jgi:hypothetical protein
MHHVACSKPMRPLRRHPRVTIELPVTVASPTRSIEATLDNVAAGGACVRTEAPAAIGAQVTLRFRMLRDRICEAQGRVVWHSAELPGFGIEFDQRNQAMDSFTSHLAKLPEPLRVVYLADVRDPRVEVE